MPLDLQKHHVSLFLKQGGERVNVYGIKRPMVSVNLFAEGPPGFSVLVETWYDSIGFECVDVEEIEGEERNKKLESLWRYIQDYWEDWISGLSNHKRLEVAAWLIRHP